MSEDAPGTEAWKAHTSAFDRVRSAAGTVSHPRSASSIADEAHVAENTARDHLERLVDLNVLLTTGRDGTTLYAPDPLHTRMETIRDLLESHDQDDLIERKADLQERIEGWRETYGIDSPNELRALASDTATARETRELRETANDWELCRYRLSLVEDAIKNYGAYSRPDRASA
ncbi:ArsR family transcriptional regulator [Saliphagus sp. LR7]|uniref:DUF7342 family protein n=1 Tax=Saliphagus sp. LR7 TaxID=2282654 RepID=UPI000DF83024|nr:ArsR family transcriptional regulator [Saliphagus sp. LR7]